MSNFRLISLTANASIWASPLNIRHELRTDVKSTDRRVGETDLKLVRFNMSEVLPTNIVDGTGSKVVLNNIRVGFTRYNKNDAGARAAFIAAWERVKSNVDAMIADGAIDGFITSSTATLNAGEAV